MDDIFVKFIEKDVNNSKHTNFCKKKIFLGIVNERIENKSIYKHHHVYKNSMIVICCHAHIINIITYTSTNIYMVSLKQLS